MKTILVILLTIASGLSYSQMINKKLDKKLIVEFLMQNREIEDESHKNEYYYDLLYSREILNIGNKEIFYEIGLTSSHSLKYIVLLENHDLIFFTTKDFDAEFKEILSYLKKDNINIQLNKFILCLEDMKDIYDFNKSRVNHSVIRVD